MPKKGEKAKKEKKQFVSWTNFCQKKVSVDFFFFKILFRNEQCEMRELFW